MSTDLFGIAVENRRSIRELIIVGSPRIDYYPLIEAARNFIKPLIFNNVHLISLDKSLINGLLVCKHCHMLFTDSRSNRSIFLKHLAKFHGIARKEPKPQTKENPIQFTETPNTINLMEPKTEVRVSPTEPTRDVAQEAAPSDPNTQFPVFSQGVPPKESGTLKEEWPQVDAPSEGERKSHHKKKIPINICADTISVPTTPFPVVSDEWVIDWEAPLEKKPNTLKRKAGTKAVTMKKSSKKPKLDSEEHEQKPRIPILHLHLKPPRAIKPRAKQPELGS